MNSMIRIRRAAAWALAAALCLALAGCTAAPSGSTAPSSGSFAPEASPAPSSGSVPSVAEGDRKSAGQTYAFALRDARPAEDNEYVEIVSGDAGSAPFFAVNPSGASAEEADATIPMMLETLGVDAASLEAYAFSLSMMNVRAYALGVFLPAEGKAGEVRAALEEYVSLQRGAFEQYLEDQYEIARGALIRTLPGGEIVLVMAEDAAGIMENLEKAL